MTVRPLLIWQMTHWGFCAELNNLLFAYLFALFRNIDFALCAQKRNGSCRLGWRDYFEPFCREMKSAGIKPSDPTVLPALASFVDSLACGTGNYLLPHPARGSACKRLHRIAKQLGFTRRRSANGAMALEITEGFRRFAPRDPVKYDFALTRFGIRAEFGPLPI